MKMMKEIQAAAKGEPMEQGAGVGRWNRPACRHWLPWAGKSEERLLVI